MFIKVILESRNKFNLIFELSRTQPWVAKRVEELDHLLWEDCDTEEKRLLILELLNRFLHISRDKYSDLVTNLADKITKEQGISDESTQVVAMAADSSADSSQYLLYDLKRVLEKKGWRKYKHINTFGRSYAAYKENNSLRNIILVDEFVGTGETVLSRVKELLKVYERAGVTDIKIFVKVIASTKQGLEAVTSAGINLESLVTINKGISDYYKDTTLKEKVELMDQIESILLDSYNGTDLPKFGYGKTESLYIRDEGNTPNSVFPIFWWPFLKNGAERPVLLTRAMGDA